MLLSPFSRESNDTHVFTRASPVFSLRPVSAPSRSFGGGPRQACSPQAQISLRRWGLSPSGVSAIVKAEITSLFSSPPGTEVSKPSSYPVRELGHSPSGGKTGEFSPSQGPGYRREADTPRRPLTRDAGLPERSLLLAGVWSPSSHLRRSEEASSCGRAGPGAARPPPPVSERRRRQPPLPGGSASPRHQPSPSTPRFIPALEPSLSPSPSKTGEGEETGATVK